MNRRDAVRLSLVTALCCAAVGACHGARIDGSSPERLQASMQRMGDGLSEEERGHLGEAAMTVAMDGLSFADLAAMSEEEIQARTAAQLDGMTADELLTRADEIRAERVAAEQAQLRMDIADLERRKSEADAAMGRLEGFRVESARFRQVPQAYGGPQPVIDLTVRNGTGTAVSRGYFRGVVATPGRAVPWLDEEFNYQIPGGLEPGEAVTWALEPNQFSEWGQVRVPSDAVMTVEVVDLDGPDGVSVLGDAVFTSADEERLLQLRGRLVE